MLRFWFDELSLDQHFFKDQAIDKLVAKRFGSLQEELLSNDALSWVDVPEALFAAIIVLDQFSRHFHRHSGKAYEADALARSLALRALACGLEDRYTAEQRRFLYMPLPHAEDTAMQALSVTGYEALGIPEALRRLANTQR